MLPESTKRKEIVADCSQLVPEYYWLDNSGLPPYVKHTYVIHYQSIAQIILTDE
jgi:hypothetical protein